MRTEPDRGDRRRGRARRRRLRGADEGRRRPGSSSISAPRSTSGTSRPTRSSRWRRSGWASAATPSRRCCLATPALQLPPETISAEDLLVWAYEQFGDRLCLTCSWQKQSSVLVHMVSELDLPIDVIELDTQLFFRESYETRDRLVERYGLNLIQPQVITVAEQHRQEGPNLWERDPDRCCEIRKVQPLLEALAPYECVGVRHPPRPVAEPRGHAEDPVVGAVRGLEAAPARRLGREARLGLHQRQRDSLQPAARDRLPVDRVHPLHPADGAGGGGARRPLGRLRQARVRHPCNDKRRER